MKDILFNKIEQYDNIIIAKHVSPDWDAQGSAYGLKYIIEENFSNKNVYIVGEDLKNPKCIIDDVTEIELSKSILITVDVANKERIDFDQIDECAEIFKIDHHIIVDNYAQNQLIDEKSIACTQVITLWAAEFGLAIPKRAAEYLYKGLITDSGRFLFEAVSTKTFDAAKILLECGISITEIYNSLYLKKLEVVEWNNNAFSKKQLVKDYPIAFIKLDKNDYKEFNLSDDEIKNCLVTMSGIKEIEIWFIAYEDEKNQNIKVSLRSREFNINEVASQFNGGGHKLASGAKLSSWNEIDVLIDKLKQLIDKKEK